MARGADAVKETAEELRALGCEMAWVSADLGDRAELARGADAAAGPFGDPDILVNCAGLNLRTHRVPTALNTHPGKSARSRASAVCSSSGSHG